MHPTAKGCRPESVRHALDLCPWSYSMANISRGNIFIVPFLEIVQ